MIRFLKHIFQKKKANDLNAKKIITIENEIIKFNDYNIFSDKEEWIEELPFSMIEWIEITSGLVDHTTLESCVYIKAKNR